MKATKQYTNKEIEANNTTAATKQKTKKVAMRISRKCTNNKIQVVQAKKKQTDNSKFSTKAATKFEARRR